MSTNVRRWFAVLLPWVVALSAPHPATAQSGLQITPDRSSTVISKDIGGQRWAIVRNPDGSVTGNVFSPEGGPPSFVWCEEGAVQDGEVALSCFGTQDCPNAPCRADAWDLIGEVSLPESFFAPPASANWVPLAALGEGARQEHPTLAFEREIWVFGGFNGRVQTIPSVEVYDPATDQWRSDVAPMPAAMHHANVAAVAGRIYVLGFLAAGGFRPDGRVFIYDPTTNTWSNGTPMPEGRARGASGVGAIGSKIYVAGGLGGGVRAEFSAYDTATDEWEILPDLPRALDHHAAAAVDGVFYVLGGRGGGIEAVSPAVYAFDPSVGEWSRGADMPTPRGGVAAAVANGRIFVLGGEGNPAPGTFGVFPDVEAYDPATDRWEVLPPMAEPRHGMGAAHLDGRIYVPGGAIQQAFGAVSTVDAMIVP